MNPLKITDLWIKSGSAVTHMEHIIFNMQFDRQKSFKTLVYWGKINERFKTADLRLFSQNVSEHFVLLKTSLEAPS